LPPHRNWCSRSHMHNLQALLKLITEVHAAYPEYNSISRAWLLEYFLQSLLLVYDYGADYFYATLLLVGSLSIISATRALSWEPHHVGAMR
jgi:hypothetical protein